MNLKLVQKVLQNKINHWAKAVEKHDKNIAQLIRTKSVVMGGAIPSLLTNEEVNDFDIYFVDEESALAVFRFYTNQALAGFGHSFIKTESPLGYRIKIDNVGAVENQDATSGENFFSEGDSLDEKEVEAVKSSLGLNKVVVKKQNNDEKYNVKCVTQNAITLDGKIQIVTRFIGTPEEIEKYYDFEHCKMWYRPNSVEGVQTSVSAMDALLNKNLKYTGSKFPICSLFRMRKYIKKGYTINAGQILKISMQISLLDLTDIDVLFEQLIGVDAAFFMQIIDDLQRTKAEMENRGFSDWKPSEGYIYELVDKYFN